MSGADASDRLLTFELGTSLYALPISGVLEVAEPGRVTCIPTLPTRVGGVINYHGDALPLVDSATLLDVEAAAPAGSGKVLVVTDRSSGAASLGLPVDRVLGLVDGPAADAEPGGGVVAERRSIDGRVASVLDPGRLVAQAKRVIESSLGRGES